MIEWEQGFGVCYKNPNGGRTAIIDNSNKLNKELLPSSFTKNKVSGDDVISAGNLKRHLEKQSPGLYEYSQEERDKAKQGDVGIYLVFDDRSILKLGNNYLT